MGLGCRQQLHRVVGVTFLSAGIFLFSQKEFWNQVVAGDGKCIVLNVFGAHDRPFAGPLMLP